MIEVGGEIVKVEGGHLDGSNTVINDEIEHLQHPLADINNNLELWFKSDDESHVDVIFERDNVEIQRITYNIGPLWKPYKIRIPDGKNDKLSVTILSHDPRCNDILTNGKFYHLVLNKS